MESSKLTDEQLIELANSEVIEESDEVWDVKYYQERHSIIDGNYKIYNIHLYDHYKTWSVNPVSIDTFIDLLQLKNKNSKILYIDNQFCNIDLAKLIGEYVKKERKRKKEETFRQVSSIKSKTKCKN